RQWHAGVAQAALTTDRELGRLSPSATPLCMQEHWRVRAERQDDERATAGIAVRWRHLAIDLRTRSGSPWLLRAAHTDWHARSPWLAAPDCHKAFLQYRGWRQSHCVTL